jgi:maltose O-acetyltransferase
VEASTPRSWTCSARSPRTRPWRSFADIRTVPQPGLNAHDEQAALREKFRAAETAFPARTLKGGIIRRAHARIKRLLVAGVLALARRSGRLHGLMGSFRFANALGPDRRRAAWEALGAKVHSTAGIGPQVMMKVPHQVSIGAGSLLRGRVTIESYGEVTIGRNTMLNNGIALFSAQHDVDDPSLKGERRTVSIGDYAWLPRGIMVLPGVHIGSFAVIGTGSVVSRDVPDYAVAVGNPARVVRERARVRHTYVPIFLDRPAMAE